MIKDLLGGLFVILMALSGIGLWLVSTTAAAVFYICITPIVLVLIALQEISHLFRRKP